MYYIVILMFFNHIFCCKFVCSCSISRKTLHLFCKLCRIKLTRAFFKWLGSYFCFVRFLEKPIVFFDIEATGVVPRADRIVELCLVRIEPDGRRETGPWLTTT